MAREGHGVTYYATGIATVFVHFANGDVCCNNCEFCFKERAQDRCRCRLLRDEIIPTDCITFGTLPDCPIQVDFNDNKEEQ